MTSFNNKNASPFHLNVVDTEQLKKKLQERNLFQKVKEKFKSCHVVLAGSPNQGVSANTYVGSLFFAIISINIETDFKSLTKNFKNNLLRCNFLKALKM